MYRYSSPPARLSSTVLRPLQHTRRPQFIIIATATHPTRCIVRSAVRLYPARLAAAAAAAAALHLTSVLIMDTSPCQTGSDVVRPPARPPAVRRLLYLLGSRALALAHTHILYNTSLLHRAPRAVLRSPSYNLHLACTLHPARCALPVAPCCTPRARRVTFRARRRSHVRAASDVRPCPALCCSCAPGSPAWRQAGGRRPSAAFPPSASARRPLRLSPPIGLVHLASSASGCVQPELGSPIPQTRAQDCSGVHAARCAHRRPTGDHPGTRACRPRPPPVRVPSRVFACAGPTRATRRQVSSVCGAISAHQCTSEAGGGGPRGAGQPRSSILESESGSQTGYWTLGTGH
ncbi:hypothetical protein C2E23DRAFT_445641 [Lenzites betulinus]|nr:hypothetical protein C2E23DRAFT_445641 [Lenzites betulinus]